MNDLGVEIVGSGADVVVEVIVAGPGATVAEFKAALLADPAFLAAVSAGAGGGSLWPAQLWPANLWP